MTASSQDGSWTRCGWGERCVGIPLGRDGRCVAHTEDQERRQSALADLREDRRLDFTAGVPISPGLLAEILTFAPQGRSGAAVLRHADFSRATFEGRVDFRGVSFEGEASFRSAVFTAGATFRRATFDDGVDFCWTEIQGRADFRGVRFMGRADFRWARFVRPSKPGPGNRAPTGVRFDGSFFMGEAVFDHARFMQGASFKGAWLLAGARFIRARFAGSSSFARARLLGPTRFDAAGFTRRPYFWLCRYPGTALDPILQGQHRYVPELFSQGAPYGSPDEVLLALHALADRTGDPAIAAAARRLVAAAGGIDREPTAGTEDQRGKPPTTSVPTRGEPSAPRGWDAFVHWLRPDREVGAATREAYEPGEAPGEFSQSTEAMRNSTRWIAAAFAGIGAVLVSGIGLSNIDYSGIGLWRSGIILAGIALALAGAGWMVYLGSRVLTLRYTTLGQLPPADDSWREVAPEFDGRALPLGEPKTVSEIADRRNQVRREIENLAIQQAEPNSDNRVEFDRLNDYRDFGRHLQRLTEIAILYYNHRVTQRRYWRFNRWAFVAAVAVVLGVLMVVLAPTGYRRLDSPTAMDVVLTSEGVATLGGQLGKACATGPLPAIGVGGTRREPRVVLLPPDDCRGQPHEETLAPALGLAVARPGQRPPQEATTPPPSLEARLRNSNTAGDPDIVLTYGRPGDELLVGDWDDDGRDSLGVWRRGVFYLRNTNDSGGADLVFRFGRPGDVPIVGDWDGDGRDSVGVRRETTFYLRNQNSTGHADVRPFRFGRPGGRVLVGDWEGIGRDSVGIRRGVNFRLLKRIDHRSRIEREDVIEFQLGGPANLPFVGNWDADPEDEVGVRRGSRFALRNELENGLADVRFEFGETTDRPLAGDWDGSGADSVGVVPRSV